MQHAPVVADKGPLTNDTWQLEPDKILWTYDTRKITHDKWHFINDTGWFLNSQRPYVCLFSVFPLYSIVLGSDGRWKFTEPIKEWKLKLTHNLHMFVDIQDLGVFYKHDRLDQTDY